MKSFVFFFTAGVLIAVVGGFLRRTRVDNDDIVEVSVQELDFGVVSEFEDDNEISCNTAERSVMHCLAYMWDDDSEPDGSVTELTCFGFTS